MKKIIGLGFMAAVALSMTSCCCERDACCEQPCPPKPRCCEARPSRPVPCCPPQQCEPRYFDNNNCGY